MEIYFLLSVLLVSTNYIYAKQQGTKSSIKGLIVREIMNKVSNFTLRSLSKVSEEKKEIVLNKIEMKLKNTAKHLTDGDKYIKMIMQEFRDKAYAKNEKKDDTTDKENNETENNAKEEDDHEKSENDLTIDNNKNEEETDSFKKVNLKVESKPNNSSNNRKIFDPLTKPHIIKDIAHKIETMAKSYLKDSQTLEQKQAILKKIEGRILESSKRKHMEIHTQHKDLKAYTDLITQGLELSMKRLLKANSRRTDNMESEEAEIDKVGINGTRGLNMKHINRYKVFFSDILSETSIDPHCADVVEGICLRIHSLYNLPCGDGKIIVLDQLCDGVFDCWNEADETNCTNKVIDKIQRSSTLMKDVEESITTKCLHPLVGGPIFTHHHAILSNMLESQLDILQDNDTLKKNSNMTVAEEAFFMKKKIGDATTIVSSLSSALEINLCSVDRAVNQNTLTRKSMNIEANDSISTWSPKSCTCERDACKTDNCDTRCKRICWQKFRLNRWRCQSIAGDASISLDLICDGKLDCFDESDELLCAMGNAKKSKYEANTLFNDLLDIVTLKSISTEYEYSRNKLTALTGLVREMQKFATSYDVDLHAIKTTRDDYFKMLVHVYADAMRNSNLEELDRTHDFLVLLNEKMVEAMKLSHTGNENVIPSSGCFCRNGTCALMRCPQNCIAACLVEPTLTKYSCNANNLTVNLKNVCDGKKDCPNGLDEEDCKKEICRSHHLMLLRHNLQNTGLSLHGTLMGEALDNWRAKVMASLRIAEKGERPTHKTLEETVVNILHDLVATYASMEETRKSGAERIKEFINLSNVVKETVKSCGN